MQKSESLYNSSSAIFPGGVNSPVRFYEPYPEFIERGNGAHIFDADGREYSDFCLAYGPLILGHRHPTISRALQTASEIGVNFGAPSSMEVELGNIIHDAIPAMEMLRFTSSGTEATMHAIRAARAYSGKKAIIKAEGCFHGSHDYALISAGSGALTHGVPSSPGIPAEVSETVAVADFNDADSFRSVIKDRGADEIAAIIVEPVMGNTGVILPKEGFLQELREIATDNSILLILDEVITGFRYHFGAYHDLISVKPDLVTIGKIIGGGLPIGAFGGTREIMSMISPQGPAYVSGTFSGNVASMLGGIETLNYLKHADYASLSSSVEKLAAELSDLIGDLGTVNYIGTMFQLFFSSGKVTNYREAMRADNKKFKKFFSFALKRGLYIPPSCYETNFVSFVHSGDDMNLFLQTLEAFLKNEEN